jgi:hypothetical protein
VALCIFYYLQPADFALQIIVGRRFKSSRPDSFHVTNKKAYSNLLQAFFVSIHFLRDALLRFCLISFLRGADNLKPLAANGESHRR